MTEAELEARMPHIDFTEPVKVSTIQGATGLGCRFCIGMKGLKGSEVGQLPQTEEAFNNHLLQVHNRVRRSDAKN